MATFRRRPSALREISKNICKNDESEEMSASPSPSEWIKQVQSQRYSQYDTNDDNENLGSNQFAFRTTNRMQEIIGDNEESEMESDYVETEVSEEEIRNIQVPREREIEIDESESQSDYTSIADQSPLYSSTNTDIPSKKPKNRRQSMPYLNINTLNTPSDDDIRSPNTENRAPPHCITSPRLSTVNEEHKDTDDNDSEKHCGSMNRSLILSQCFEDTQSIIKHKKRSILPPQELTFDEIESPAPPSILKKNQYTTNNTNTPGYGDIADKLANINNLLHTSERRRGIGTRREEEVKEKDIEPSPLIDTRQRSPVSVDKSESRQSGYHRKHSKPTPCGQGVMDDLDQHMKRLKQVLPSPGIDKDTSNDAMEEKESPPFVKSKASAIRRRSARLAQKRGSVLSSSEENEEEQMDLSNVSTRNRRTKQRKRKKKKEDDILPPHIPYVDERPYIDDYEEDEVLNDNPPLPSTKKKNKTKSHKHSKEEEDAEVKNIKRRTLDISARSNKSNISDKSSRRTRTLRSRKEDTLSNIESPISDNDNDDEYTTFGTPKKDRLNRSNRSKSRGKSSRGGSKKRKKTPKQKKTSNKKQTKTAKVHNEENDDDLNANYNNYDDYDGMDDMDPSNVEDNVYDSPNINENDDEKQEIQVTKDNDDDDKDDDGDIAMKSHRKTRSHSKDNKEKKSKKKKKKNVGNKEEASTKKTKSKKKTKKKKKENKKDKTKAKDKKTKSRKSRKSRKRKASETELSDSESASTKRRRLSQYVIEAPSVPSDTKCRRSKRVRFKPMAYWASERVEYTPTPLTTDRDLHGVITGLEDRLLPSLKQKKAKANKKKTPPKASKKKSKRSRVKSPEIISDDDDGGVDEEDNVPFNGNAWIYDPNTDQMSEKCVAKTDKSLNLVPLALGNDNNNNGEEPTSKRVRGAKGLEEEAFSCGVLEIPPESQKHAEVSYFTEQFFVHQSERKKLLFKVGDESQFYLSRGSMFYVPPENEYSLHNLSKTVPIKLIFTLIKHGNNRNEDDTQTQISATQNSQNSL